MSSSCAIKAILNESSQQSNAIFVVNTASPIDLQTLRRMASTAG